jgi:hypothetical protein
MAGRRQHLGVDCYRLRRERDGSLVRRGRPFMALTPADQFLIETLVEDSPGLTIAGLRAAATYAPDIHALCDRHIADGFGDVPAEVMCN